MHPFANKITCPDCSGWFGRKVWRCNNKYKPGYRCTTPIVTEQQIKDAFVQALTERANDDAVLDDAMRLIDNTVYNTTEREDWQAEFASQMEEAVALINHLINKNGALRMIRTNTTDATVNSSSTTSNRNKKTKRLATRLLTSLSAGHKPSQPATI